MENSEYQKPLSPEESKFYEYLKTGDDFSKIEIYRLAKYWYTRALDTGVGNDLVRTKITESNQKIKSEEKTFTVLGILAVLVIIAVFLTMLN